ncbi:hypothetical protein ACWGS9_33600 [Bradyrhizobium sp. Arg314]
MLLVRQEIAKRSCHREVYVAVAAKLAVIMRAIWSDGTFYVGDSALARPSQRSARMARTASFWGALMSCARRSAEDGLTEELVAACCRPAQRCNRTIWWSRWSPAGSCAAASWPSPASVR